ncbi:MAG TPA: flagellar hook-associated protein FlgK, partial [Rhodospirillaceae bacterium]|nr:flagellar hook-associated protein FlgK [Rhodospirillaceae bacterium]
MSINLALESALSGLLTSQKALDVVSNNVANLNTPGYTRQQLVEESNTLSGTGAGVMSAGIKRTVAQGLVNSIQTANGTLNQLTTNDQFYTQIQNLFGTPKDASSISGQIQGLINDVQSLAATPNQPPTTVVNDLSQVASSLQSMSTSVQSLRDQADQQIGDAVTAVNTALNNIAVLNNQIGTNGVAGVNTNDLQDKRDSQLKTLASYLTFVSFPRPDGTISIYTPQGTPLLDSSAKTVSHDATTAIEPRMTYDINSGTGSLQGVKVNGTDIS